MYFACAVVVCSLLLILLLSDMVYILTDTVTYYSSRLLKALAQRCLATYIWTQYVSHHALYG